MNTVNNQLGIHLNGAGRTSSLGLTGCYNVCGFTHPFNKTKRQECQARCDAQFTGQQEQEDKQQELLEQMINDDSGGLSTGAIVGIIAGIMVFTIVGVVVIKKLKKKNA